MPFSRRSGDGRAAERRRPAVHKLEPVSEDRLKTLEQRTRYEPGDVEGRIFRRWEESGFFHPEPEGSAAENFSIAIPPPNVTGALHMGHALNGTIQDTLIRMRRMQGRRTKWIFGTDHAGIATQVKVEKQLAEEGTSRQELGRERFVERVWEWREKYGSQIIGRSEPPRTTRTSGSPWTRATSAP
jgi:valyl-tRNA synthetase